MITKIGFKNFRRFHEQTDIELGGINMFVGGNNAGKSTVVKALLLMINFLKNTIVPPRMEHEKPKFEFYVPFVNIDDMSRAKCWDSVENDKLSFNVTIDNFDISVKLFESNANPGSYGDIENIVIYDEKSDIRMSFHVADEYTDIEFGVREYYDNSLLHEPDSAEVADLKVELEGLTNEIEKCISEGQMGEDFQRLVEEKKEIESLLKYSVRHESQYSLKSARVKLYIAPGCQGANYIYSLIYSLSNTNLPVENAKVSKGLKLHQDVFKQIANDFEEAINKINTELICAHSATQRVLFNTKDNNDNLAHCVQVMYNERITSLSKTGILMKEWLSLFVGIDDFKIVPVSALVRTNARAKKIFEIGQGEGYAFGVKFNDKWHDLGDMGRGTIQLTVLLMHLAIIIKQYDGASTRPIVLVEEPEQNLHPALQSLLTDLFYQLYKEYGLSLIIETHSEYIIRNTQVIVGNQSKSLKTNQENWTNPFRVYFFPNDGQPYDMEFTNVGGFKKKFGNGFFNEAGRLNSIVMNNKYENL